MYSYKRLLVSLDLTEMDNVLLSYTSFIAKLFKAESIYFLHVAKSLEVPKKLQEQYPDMKAPSAESIAQQIQENIDTHFTADCDYSVDVQEGNAEDKLLRWADLKKIDLLVLGRKVNLKGKGTLPGKVAKTIHCSVLIVPETTKNTIEKIIVPVDFSKPSALALEEALKVQENTNAQIIVQNSFEVPSGYHTIGKSYEEFAEIMKSNAYEDLVNFLHDSSLKPSQVDIDLSLDDNNDPADNAWIAAEQKNADIIIIGSKGRTGMASILLGSVADKIVRHESKIPVLVVKDKKENMSFLQALLKL